ncbi:MAG: bifunctional preprotein translocase subunit SecD/SecF [Bacteroidetes bacterium]|nr:bifunctional preprotein translocase subunit SecD/SecF [Bacteroidota bacterium]
MQNKGAIKIIAVIFALVCLYQLSFTYFTKSVESDAKEYATNNFAKNEAKRLANGNALREQEIFNTIQVERENYYLDSISEKPIYNFLWMRKFNYKECKAREINLGLDLKGGMNVKMEVSTIDVVKNLATNPKDPAFEKLTNHAISIQKNSGKPFINCFEQAVKESGKIDLSAFFRVKLKEKGITTNSTNEQVLGAIKAECTEAYDRTFQVLSKRIDKFGVSNPTIQKLESSERILIELPGVKDPQRVSRLLEGTAQLEFWLAGDFGKVYQGIVAADSWLASVGDEKIITDTTIEKDSILLADNLATETTTSTIAPLKTEKKDTLLKSKRPLISLFTRLNKGDLSPSVVGTATASMKKEINRQLARASKVLPQDVMFLWSAKPIDKTNEFELYIIQYTNKAKTALLDGDVIDDARQDFDQQGRPVVSMSMKAEAARKWGKITGSNIGNSIAIVLDSVVYSAPRVNSEINGGRSEISGNFSVEEAKDLANILKSGKLTAPARVVQESVVGPSLGEESIKAGLVSFLFSFLLICLYMLFFYSIAGFSACVALVVNLFFLFGVLASIGAVLTLSGIAGIVLTLAMAVDANVIINERIKEELAQGKNLSTAIADGYKAAYSAIIDGNVTTLITGIILAYFGAGSVLGFAVTLCIGLLTSLFTSIFISRLVLESMLKSKTLKDKIKFSTSLTERFLKNTKIDFVKNSKKQLIIFGALSLVFLGFITFRGLDYGIDFTGGRTYIVRFDQDVNPNDIRTSLAKEFESAPEVKTFGPNYQVKITTDYKVKEDNESVKREVIQKLYNGTKGFYKDKDIELSEYVSTLESPLGIISSEIVGPTIADDIKTSAIIAVIIALIAIFIYIAIRFNKWQYGLGGLAALAFDTLFTIGVFSIFKGILPFSMEVDMNFVAAILTIVGYSINDTVIIFDRVRENVHLYPNYDFGKTMNLSINQTLSRTVNTVCTVFLALIIILVFGGDVLRGFAFALTIGTVSGSFSTLFISSPIAYLMIKNQNKKATMKVNK